jgi:hypothetical protein
MSVTLTGDRVDGCRFCESVARFGPSRGKPVLEHRHEIVEGQHRAVTDEATALDGSRTTGFYDEDQNMWRPMPVEVSL